MRVVISVVGLDKVGILANVATKCMEFDANIVDVSQKVLDDFFTMIMIVEWRKTTEEFRDFIGTMEAFGNSNGLKIHVMHEDVFKSMHTI